MRELRRQCSAASMTPRKPKPPVTHLVDGDDQVIEVGGQCGLYVDLQPDEPAPIPGDWVATNAGSRYLVDDVRLVRSRRHSQIKRYQMRMLRLPKNTSPPADVRVIWLRWYPRGGSR